MRFFLIWFSCLLFVKTCLTLSCETIHCKGKILETIQLRRLFPDEKSFVDMATKYSEEQIIESFESLPENVTNEELIDWVKYNFYEPGYEIDRIIPNDWVKNVDVINKQRNPLLYNLVKNCHYRWLLLTKFFNESKLSSDSVSSFLPVKYPFVVPGGRFIEFYYWDSYWILEGLLVSEMYETAANMILNFVEIINKYNFIPNGSRTYFLNRSQPPLLVKMLVAYYERTGDSKLVFESLRALDREYDFFMKEKSVVLNLDEQEYILNRYNVKNEKPRPESFKEDYDIAQTLSSEALQKRFYSNIASAAESGWDFSTRWYDLKYFNEDESNLSKIGITNLLPVDLNAILYYNERQLQRFYCKWATERAEFNSKCFWYGRLSRNRFRAMKKFLFNKQLMQWSDFNFTRKMSTADYKLRVNEHHQIDSNGNYLIRPLYISDLSSLWFLNEDWRTNDVRKLENDQISFQEKIISDNIKFINDYMMEKLTENLDEILDETINYQGEISDYVKLNEWQELLFKKGGIPISNINSGEQWDYPNAWAPYQVFLIEALLAYHKESSLEVTVYKKLALYLAQKWLHSNYCSFKKYNSFFEKYNVDRIGEAGSGGEYIVQEGFGWTNGVLLMLTEKLGSEIELNPFCENI